MEPFLIAKYLVTYRQYKAFLDDPRGYRDKRWWNELTHARPQEQYRQFGNFPAENVSWSDATAYCRWVSARIGFDVRLPTEPEWQQAATGGDATNVYPWGDWVDGRANTSESRLGRTTPVGVYPRGASPQGVLDLAGSVWEWCSTEYDVNPEILAREPGAPTIARWAKPRRVVRGGSGHLDRALARCMPRNSFHPDVRFNFIGFRVVRDSPMP